MPAKFVLAHVECKPSFAHSSADVRINGGCVPWCVLVHLRFFHIGTLLSSSISRQLALSPMRVFVRSIERPFDVPVQSAQHPDARVHQEIAALGGTDQAAGRGLPFLEVLLCLGQLHDVVGGILEGDELATVGQRYRVIELSRPAQPGRLHSSGRRGSGAR
jgi:hypothetical protein